MPEVAAGCAAAVVDCPAIAKPLSTMEATVELIIGLFIFIVVSLPEAIPLVTLNIKV